jgi:hypothetical protein
MLLDVGSTNGMPRGEHAVPSSFCHVPSLDQAGLRQARLVSHKIIGEIRRKKKACHCNYSMASAFELIFTCIHASLESGFDCVVGGLRLVASWLDLPRFPMQTHVRSDGQHIMLHHLIRHWYLTNGTRGLLDTSDCFALLVRSTQ